MRTIFWFATLLVISSCGYARHIRIAQESAIYPLKPNINAIAGYQAGVSKAVITPAHDSWLAGFLPWRSANGVHDDLEVRTVAAVDPTGKAYVFVTVDLIGFMYDDVMRLRQKISLPNVEIFVMSSHTHAGPDVIGFWGAPPFFSGRDEKYIDEVIDIIAKSVLVALNNIQPVSIYAGATDVINMSKNRREDYLDTELAVLDFHNGEIGHIAILINFACHPEVLKENNYLITSDFVGAMRSHLDYELRGTTLFVNGSIGGSVSPNMAWNESETFARRDEFGEKLGEYALRAMSDISINTPLISKPIVHIRRIIKIPLTNKFFWSAALLGIMPERGVILSGGYLTTEVNVLKIGNVTVVMIPGEIVPELGLEIKKMGGTKTQVWTLANDEIGYILKKEKFYTKTFDYERLMSVGPDAGSIIMEAVKQMLSESAAQ